MYGGRSGLHVLLTAEHVAKELRKRIQWNIFYLHILHAKECAVFHGSRYGKNRHCQRSGNHSGKDDRREHRRFQPDAGAQKYFSLPPDRTARQQHDVRGGEIINFAVKNNHFEEYRKIREAEDGIFSPFAIEKEKIQTSKPA